MADNFNFKDFEKVQIKSTYNIEVGNKTIVAGETIAFFDKIQIAGIDGYNSLVRANGGFNNRSLIFWEEQNEQKIQFSQGVFSKEQLALLNNSRLISKSSGNNIEIFNREILESNENYQITLQYIPFKDLYVYDLNTGARITNFTRTNKIITLSTAYQKVIVDYIFQYSNSSSVFEFGQQLISGYVSLEGRTRVKDDTTGHIITGIIKVPKIKLMSNLSIRMGNDAMPMTGRFEGIAIPVGSRGNAYISELHLLSDDINSDL